MCLWLWPGLALLESAYVSLSDPMISILPPWEKGEGQWTTLKPPLFPIVPKGTSIVLGKTAGKDTLE